MGFFFPLLEMYLLWGPSQKELALDSGPLRRGLGAGVVEKAGREECETEGRSLAGDPAELPHSAALRCGGPMGHGGPGATWVHAELLKDGLGVGKGTDHLRRELTLAYYAGQMRDPHQSPAWL